MLPTVDSPHAGPLADETSAHPPSVAMSTKKQDGRRKWDKKNVCFFCGRALSNIGRHLGNLHADEPEVVRYLRYPKLSAERKDLISDLVKRGNFKHHFAVLKVGEGVIVPRKRPNETRESREFLPCDLCYGFFVKERLAIHQKTCKPDDVPPVNRNAKTRGSLLLLGHGEDSVSQEFRDKVLLRMSQDEVFEVVKDDRLISTFGSLLYEKLDSRKVQLVRNITFQLRELGGLLLRMRATSKVRSFQECFEVRYYKCLVDAVKFVARYDEKTGKFGVPSLAAKIGSYVRKCGRILSGIYAKENDEEGKRKAEEFLEVMEVRWKGDVSSKAVVKVVRRKKRDGTRKDKHTKQPWSVEEKSEVMRFFDEFIRTKKTPGKTDCDKCKEVNACLAGRSWSDIKFCVYNQIRKTF